MSAHHEAVRAHDVAVRLEQVTRQFDGRVILDALDLEIRAGEFVCLLGQSGSGKSTLLRAIARLDDPGQGSGTLTVPHRRAMVFQDARLLPWARLIDNVILGIEEQPEARRRGLAALAEVGLGERGDAWPIQLSGGEQQRVALARALVGAPELLLADEPFGALDALTRIRMHALLRDLCARHRPAVLLVTHDVDEAIELADRVLVLERGRWVVDLPIILDAPRNQRAGAFLQYRESLLRALGVDGGGERTSTAPAPLAR